jgi:Transposase DDE domain/Transposase domain (DUF772)
LARIYQKSLFSWKDVDELGDLERLELIIETMPDKKLITKLEQDRKNGRNDYPIRAIWNSILAGIVYQHPSIESLRRELQRNPLLREMCGFDPLKGASAIPSSMAYSRFIAMLIDNQMLIDEMFDEIVEHLRKILPEFGKNLAFDGKAICSLSGGKKGDETKTGRRGERDADWGVKKYKGKNDDGSAWEKVKSWFGFRLHLIVDVQYELPVTYRVTKASLNEQPVIRELFKDTAEKHPELIDTCDHAMGDKGYDSLATISLLWETYNIKPIIDIKNQWKDADETRQLKTRDIENATYDHIGTVFCHCPATGEIRKMTYGGFEEERQSLKYLCPAKQFGIHCQGAANCPLRGGLRVPLTEDRRIFTPVARSSYKWKRLYNKRTSVERVNSRLDVSFGFEKHFIRGLEKMRLRCGLALCVMLTLALGRARQNKMELIRSLVKAA